MTKAQQKRAEKGKQREEAAAKRREAKEMHEQEQEGIIKSMTKTREKWKYDTGKVMAHDI